MGRSAVDTPLLCTDLTVLLRITIAYLIAESSLDALRCFHPDNSCIRIAEATTAAVLVDEVHMGWLNRHLFPAGTLGVSTNGNKATLYDSNGGKLDVVMINGRVPQIGDEVCATQEARS